LNTPEEKPKETAAAGEQAAGKPAQGTGKPGEGPGGVLRIIPRVASAVLLSPVLRLEYRVFCVRSHLPYVIASLLAALTGFIFTVIYGASGDFRHLDPSSGGWGARLFLWETAVMMTYVVLVGSFLASTSFSREKRDGTMDLLTSTALGAASVVGGKLVSSFLRIFIPLCAVLPYLILGVLIGGVGWWEIPKHLGLLASVALLVSAMGLLWSLIFRPVVLAGITTAMFTYGTFAFIVILCLIVFRGIFHLEGWAWVGVAGCHLATAALVWIVAMLIYRRAVMWDY
jgi:hypothetical protein